MTKPIIVRVQSPDHGTKRIETYGSETMSSFFDKVQRVFDLSDIGWTLSIHQNGKTGLLANSRAKKLDYYNLKHGDILFMSLENRANCARNISLVDSSALTDISDPQLKSDNVSNVLTKLSSLPIGAVIEHEVDIHLEKMDGKIYRQRNQQLCHHGSNGKCLHCAPLEPYDEQFLKSCDPPIKFLSFHSYIRKLTGGVDKGKFMNLENLSCKIKPGCREHPPWPGGICTKCQPNAVTLNRQSYRHVDYIMFENPTVADRLLNYWRSTGHQRIGILYGRYEMHKDVPLAVKATVAAVYEPPQVTSPNHVELLSDPKEKQVNEMASHLNLQPVGWIFLDLVADDLSMGTVKNFRGNIDSHFLSAEECILAGAFQNKYPSPCRLSPEGHFGSKFVTIIVTGDKDKQIHFEGYQVSNQCMALVRDECLIPTKDAPELGYVKESSNEQYVPDVFYKSKDIYNNSITQLARPLPVEYLLVDMPAAFPADFLYTFSAQDGVQPFPVENRGHMGETQDFNTLLQYLEQFDPSNFLTAISDFHVLLFLSTSEVIPVRDCIAMLLDAVRTQDEQLALQFKKTEEWSTVEEMMSDHGLSHETQSLAGAADTATLPSHNETGPSSMWTCAHCTFINQHGLVNCEMCSLPKQLQSSV